MERPASKIKKIRDLVRIVDRLKSEGKKIVHCHGVFDLIHPGHIRHLTSAKRYGDVLIVTITADEYVRKGPERPIFKQELRAEVLATLSPIDYVGIIESDSAVEAIKKIKPDFYVKGPDYKTRKVYTTMTRKLTGEEEAVEALGGKLVFTEDKIIFSSSKLINEYLDVYPEKTREYLDSIKNAYTADYILERLGKLRDLKVLVIGEAIIDQYHYCLSLGKSSKEPVMVYRYISEENFAGGTLATANHLAALTPNITLVTLLGKKRSFKSFILKNLESVVKPIFFYQSNHHTIVKRRYLDPDNRQKLFQISYLHDEMVSPDVARRINRFLKKEIKKYDLVIVNDYGHGFFTDKTIKLICQRANFLALNVQANSANYGFNIITKYPRADFVCIDEAEIRLSLHDKQGELFTLIKKIYKRMKTDFIMVTKGPKGSISYSKATGLREAPALTERIVDRVGAGDALFAITSPCVAIGIETDLVQFLGNVAGALKVQIVGNREAVSMDSMGRYITRLLK